MLDASKTYLDWTGGWNLIDGGVEGFITSWIAKRLIDDTRKRRGPKGGYVALELTLDRLMNDLSPEYRGAHFRNLLDEACSGNAATAKSSSQRARTDLSSMTAGGRRCRKTATARHF